MRTILSPNGEKLDLFFFDGELTSTRPHSNTTVAGYPDRTEEYLANELAELSEEELGALVESSRNINSPGHILTPETLRSGRMAIARLKELFS